MIKGYTLKGAFKLIKDTLITKAFFSKSRIVRSPFYIRGKKYINFGKGLTTGVGLRLDVFNLGSNENPKLDIGDNVEFNDYVHIGVVDRVTIGHNVLIASKVFISDHNHGIYSGAKKHSSPKTIPSKRVLNSAPIVISDNVWLGENVSVLQGVTIGLGSVIGANSVVTTSIPDYSIAVGSPAKVIKQFNFKSEKWEGIK